MNIYCEQQRQGGLARTWQGTRGGDGRSHKRRTNEGHNVQTKGIPNAARAGRPNTIRMPYPAGQGRDNAWRFIGSLLRVEGRPLVVKKWIAGEVKDLPGEDKNDRRPKSKGPDRDDS